MSILVRDARVLTMDDRDTELARADILVRGPTIAAVGPDVAVPLDEPGLRVIDGRGLLAMPGLVDGQLHSPGNFMRGALDDTPLEIFMLYEAPPLAERPPSPRLHYVRTLLGAIQMLELGVTAAHDDASSSRGPRWAGRARRRRACRCRHRPGAGRRSPRGWSSTRSTRTSATCCRRRCGAAWRRLDIARHWIERHPFAGVGGAAPLR